jgi:hypothetical protein
MSDAFDGMDAAFARIETTIEKIKPAEPWYVVVADFDYDYGEEGSTEYLALEGVIGPFATIEEARAFDRILCRKHDRTEIVRMTAPGDEVYGSKYP